MSSMPTSWIIPTFWLALIQSAIAQPVINNPSVFDQAGRLTLDGALIVAVAVLWRENRRVADIFTLKDQTMLSMMKTNTETLQTAQAAMVELRRTIEQTTSTNIQLLQEFKSLRTELRVLHFSSDDPK